jgi:hypothetical protein
MVSAFMFINVSLSDAPPTFGQWVKTRPEGFIPGRVFVYTVEASISAQTFAKNDISLESVTKIRKSQLYTRCRIFTQKYSNYGILFHQRE